MEKIYGGDRVICNLDCFNCHYPDCIRPETQDENERVRKWNRDNPDKRRAIRRRYYLKTQDRAKEYQKAYYQKVKDTPEYKQARAEYMRKYRARKKAEVS